MKQLILLGAILFATFAGFASAEETQSQAPASENSRSAPPAADNDEQDSGITERGIKGPGSLGARGTEGACSEVCTEHKQCLTSVPTRNCDDSAAECQRCMTEQKNQPGKQ
ncbi:hypothetical protein [Serratia sp. AKBS12]|uniref:hypothetical protein n=1 Tax=Serratia sp. AKBS12 TaxID=2974597 RepID=UPI0021662BE6|nr:hypothetical protein [Serratia sp. AKBS12]MCS3408922.1 hypothetical protein [Serratia sp. AKBS12]HEI8865248.1 hypothetical protein [Serratia odorifera]